ncbi:MAG: alpha/beta fold hydrolase [Chloroflexota bacterium]
MKRLLQILAGLVVLVVAAGATIYFAFPQVIVDFVNNQYANAAGLEKRTLTLDGYTVNYFESAERGGKDTLVLVHGMGDDKNSFLQSAELLSKHYHLVLPDLAGHGENARDLDRDYSIDGQSTFLHDFLHAIDVTKFHLVGNSMGGHTSGAYAIKYPEDLNKLVLVNSAGLKIDDHVTYIGFGEDLESEEEFDVLLERLYYQVPDLPGPIKNLMMEQVNETNEFVDDVLITSVKNGLYFNLKDDLSKIQAPTLVYYGIHDKVVLRNAAEYFANNIPDAQLVTLENAGHVPQMEVPNVVAEDIHRFLAEE